MNAKFLNIHDTVLILTFVECLLISVLLKILPTPRPQSRQLLATFFLLVAAWVAATLLIWNRELQTLLINTTIFSPLLLSFSILLQGPCLYLYLCSLSKSLNFRNRSFYVHLIPVLSAALAIIIFKIDSHAWLPQTSLQDEQKMAAKFAWALVRCTPLVYALACFYAAYQLHRQVNHTTSSVSPFELKLTYFVLMGFFIHWLWAFAQYFAGGYLSSATNDWVGDAEDFLIVLQVNGLLILGLKNTPTLLNLSQVGVVKVTKQRLNDANIKLIEKAINEKTFFLDNNINLDRFSELVGLKPHEVSMILNTHYKLNFFDFINSLRLEEAKRLLASPEFANLSILDIIYKSGFNSQSAFQRFFKRYVGCTPTEYRRNPVQRKQVA